MAFSFLFRQTCKTFEAATEWKSREKISSEGLDLNETTKGTFLLFSFFTFGGYLAFDQRGCFNSSSFLSFSFKTSHPTPLFRHLLDSLVGKSLSFSWPPTSFGSNLLFSKSSASRISSFLPGGKETQVWPWARVGEIEGGGGRRRLISFQRNFCLLSCRRPMPIAAEGSLWQHQQLQKQQLCPPGGKIVS